MASRLYHFQEAVSARLLMWLESIQFFEENQKFHDFFEAQGSSLCPTDVPFFLIFSLIKPQSCSSKHSLHPQFSSLNYSNVPRFWGTNLGRFAWRRVCCEVEAYLWWNYNLDISPRWLPDSQTHFRSKQVQPTCSQSQLSYSTFFENSPEILERWAFRV